MDFKPILRFKDRVSTSKEDSYTTLFYDLISYAEIVVKYVALFLVANIEDNIDRTRYRFEYKLVRADGIGDFSQTIIEIITGSASDYLSQNVVDNEKVQLQSRIKPDSWQEQSVKNLQQCLQLLHIEGNSLTAKSNLLIWFSNIALLRNKTKGHGNITIEQCSQVCNLLEESIDHVVNNLSVFNRSWVYLFQNINGKYRVSVFSGDSKPFEPLKRKNSYSFRNGVYCFTDRVRPVNLCFSDENLSYYSLVNGNFSIDKYEVIDYLTNSREKKDGTPFLAPPTKLPDSITSSKEINIEGNVFSNLPESLRDYIRDCREMLKFS